MLEALKEAGVFEVNHLLPAQAGFHELDIEAFTRKLMAMTPGDAAACVNLECIKLRQVIQGRHDAPETKMEVFRAILAGEISILGNADGTPGGLLLDALVYRGFVEDVCVRAAGNAITPTEVAKSLGCDRGTVPGLVQLDLLKGEHSHGGLRVTEKSIHAFKEQYVSLATLTKSVGLRSRSLMKRCEERGINMLLVPTRRKGGPQPFVRVDEAVRLLYARPLPA
jgi:hypothetical protein